MRNSETSRSQTTDFARIFIAVARDKLTPETFREISIDVESLIGGVPTQTPSEKIPVTQEMIDAAERVWWQGVRHHIGTGMLAALYRAMRAAEPVHEK